MPLFPSTKTILGLGNRSARFHHPHLVNCVRAEGLCRLISLPSPPADCGVGQCRRVSYDFDFQTVPAAARSSPINATNVVASVSLPAAARAVRELSTTPPATKPSFTGGGYAAPPTHRLKIAMSSTRSAIVVDVHTSRLELDGRTSAGNESVTRPSAVEGQVACIVASCQQRQPHLPSLR